MPKRKIIKSKKTLSVFIIVFLLLVSLLINGLGNGFDWDKTAKTLGVSEKNEFDKYPINVHFVDVGQGDCTLITSSFGTVLVDSGESDEKMNVENYLDGLKIEKIDCLILTHPHSDHCGSMSYIVDNYEIGKFYMSEIDEENLPTSKCYENLLTSLDKEKVDCEYLHCGDRFNIGEITCETFGPVDASESLNSMSLVLKFSYKGFSVLISGDAEADEEKDILKKGFDLSADILKVGHHGSSTSSSAKFLDAVNPQYAVISLGKNNKYNHPHKQTIDKLNKRNIKYFRTDESSTVVFSYDLNQIIVNSR